MSVARGSFVSWVSVMTTADPVLVVDVVVVVGASSSTSQPKMMLLVEKTRIVVVVVTVPDVETPYDVVVAWMVADRVSHEVGSAEYVGTWSLPMVIFGQGGSVPWIVIQGGNSIPGGGPLPMR